MQTNFTPEQLRDPRIAEADASCARCVHCGLCTATCSTYVAARRRARQPARAHLPDEGHVRGRRAGRARGADHVDRCLSCLSCMTTCPSGVDYMHLVDMARSPHRGDRRRAASRSASCAACWRASLPYPERFRLALKLAPLGRPWLKLLRRFRLQGARGDDRAGAGRAAAVAEVRGPRHRRDRGRAARARHPARRLRAAGAAPRHQRCHHPAAGAARRRRRRGGRRRLLRRARSITWARRRAPSRFAKRNVDAWSKELAKEPVDAIIINASGCGTTVKDYGHLLKRRAGVCRARGTHFRAGARHHRVRRRATSWARPSAGRRCASPTIRPARCSTASASTRSRALCCIKAGFTRRRRPGRRTSAAARPAPTTFCSRRSPASCATARSKNIKRVKPDIVATGNIGCITQLEPAARHAGRAHGRAAGLGLRRAGAARAWSRSRASSPTCPSQAPHVEDYIDA